MKPVFAWLAKSSPRQERNFLRVVTTALALILSTAAIYHGTPVVKSMLGIQVAAKR